MPPLRDEWKETLAAMREIYTSGNSNLYRSNPSGPKKAKGLSKKPRTSKSVEPLTLWNKSVQFWEELIWRFFVALIIDLTPGSGLCAEAALRHKVSYLGWCMSAAHVQGLEERTRCAALKFMTDQGMKHHFNTKALASLGQLAQTTVVPPSPNKRPQVDARNPFAKKPKAECRRVWSDKPANS